MQPQVMLVLRHRDGLSPFLFDRLFFQESLDLSLNGIRLRDLPCKFGDCKVVN